MQPDYDAELQRLKEENLRLVNAIKRHRDARGHDRCWENDLELYEAIGGVNVDDFHLPPCNEFLQGCLNYWNERQPK